MTGHRSATGGRSLPPAQFADDDGSADPHLAATLEAHARGCADLADVVAAVSQARLLVPVMALPSAEMALPTLRGRDGRVGVPVFTCLAALAAWDAEARPVPADARRVALSAVGDGADVLLLDVAGPVSCVVPRPAVWALAQGREWTPSPQDPEVLGAVQTTCLADNAVLSVLCEPGERAELRVVLTVRAGLDRTALAALTDRLGERLGTSAVVAERVASLELKIDSG